MRSDRVKADHAAVVPTGRGGRYDDRRPAPVSPAGLPCHSLQLEVSAGSAPRSCWAAATYLSGSPNGVKEVQINGKKERVGAFDIAVNADQNDLVMVSAPGKGEMERGSSGSYVCKPTPAMRSEGASANASCSFEGVTPTVGGVLYSNIEESGAAEPGKTVQRSCRLVLRPLAVKPPPDPRDPPPPPRR
jgi:hypothetical protein